MTDDSLRGQMYLRVFYHASASTFADVCQRANDVWAEGRTTVAGRHIVDERTLQGDWDEGILYLGSDTSDKSRGDRIVFALLREGDWMVGFDVSYTADPSFWSSHQKGSGQVYPFTDEELADRVADTYLPQVHKAVLDAVGSTG